MGEPSFDGKYHSSRGWYVGSKDGEIETIGKKDDAAVTDPVLSASEIALLKGILKQLQGEGSGQSDFNLKQVGGTAQTGADWTQNIQKLDLALTALRDALRGVDAKTISDLAALLTAIKDTAGIKKIVDTVNVALTGSIPAGSNTIGNVGLVSRNVCIEEVISQTVGAGNTVTVIGMKDIDNYTKIYANARAETAHDYALVITRTGFDSGGAAGTTERGDFASASTNTTVCAISPVEVDCPKVYVKITNNDTVSHDYDVYLGGHR